MCKFLYITAFYYICVNFHICLHKTVKQYKLCQYIYLNMETKLNDNNKIRKSLAVDVATYELLQDICGKERRPKIDQLKVLIEQEHNRLFASQNNMINFIKKMSEKVKINSDLPVAEEVIDFYSRLNLQQQASLMRLMARNLMVHVDGKEVWGQELDYEVTGAMIKASQKSN